ncbi:MAG: ABC transporter permease [Patescibacteria group bacterium]|nr:ABC transporter permease [Patescibacteria group bacterium]MDD5534952.1 ABC transporter permease [Patescibacteria group bacterium]
MKVQDLFEETYFALLANKARTGLTVLGIVIGIGSVIAMISLGQGATGSIESSIQSIGSNLIIVMPSFQRGVGTQVSAGRGSAQTLKPADAEAIQEQITLVKAVAPELSGRYQITTKGKNTNTSVIGTTAAYSSVRNVEVDIGSFISDQNVQGSSKVAVIGPTVRDDLFGENVNPVGQTIRIKKIEFKVIGLTKTKGGSGFSNQDDQIYVPLSTAQRFLAGSEYVSTISVQAVDQKSMTELQSQITTLLLSRHNISDAALADFSTMNQSDIVESASSITKTLTMLLAAIAGISLIVGGIGIMNMMLTNVTERTREIGLRKAIGAKRSEINLQFLTEAVMVTFLGGVIGVLFGWLISLGISQFSSIATKMSLSSVLLAFGVSAAIGIIFGYYPARRAAALNPIEALRYE